MQVEIVDPSDVSEIIQLEPSSTPIPRTGPMPANPKQPVSPPRQEVTVWDNEPQTEPNRVIQRSQSPQRVEQRSQTPQRVEQLSQAPQRVESGNQRQAQHSQSPPVVHPQTRASSAPHLVGESTTGSVRSVARGEPVINERLVARKLAVSFHAAIRESQCRRVLITSPTSRSGKSHFTRLIGPELGVIAPDQYRFYRHEDLERLPPPSYEDPQITIVDGPPMFDGDGLLVVPQRWMQAFDGCVILVMGRHTESEFLSESVKWMKDSRIHIIGLIWNDYLNPPPDMRLSLWRRYFKQRKGGVFGDLIKVIATGGKSLRKPL